MRGSWLASATRLLGPVAATWYLLFTGLAWARYPGAYGPWSNNWLSDLGNRNVNPSGAGLYAIGCIGTGVLLAGFFIGMLSWRRSGSKVQDWLLLLTLFAGLIAAVSIVMSAVYSIDQYGAHQFWSRLISGSTAVAFFVTPFALRRHRQRIWPLAAVGAAGYASIVARLVFA